MKKLPEPRGFPIACGDVLPLLAALFACLAQSTLHKGVDGGALELVAIAIAVTILGRLRSGPSTARSLTVPALVLVATSTVFVHPLPPAPGRIVLTWALAAAVADLPASRHLTTERTLRVLAVHAVGLGCATHAIGMVGPPNFDSTCYLLNGRWLLEGIAPYRDSYLNKAPLILVPNVLAALASSTHVLPQLASLAAVLATGVIVARSPAVAGAGSRLLVFALTIALLSLEFYREGGNVPESYATPLIAFAWARLGGPEPRRRDLLLGGAALGLLPLVKQTHGLIAVALGLACALAHGLVERRRGLRVAGWVLTGTATSVVLALLPFVVTGLTGRLFHATVLYWLNRPPTYVPRPTIGVIIEVLVLPIAGAFVLGLSALFLATRSAIRRRSIDPATATWCALLVASLLMDAIEQLGFLNPHYVTILFVPLGLAPWIMAREVGEDARPTVRTALLALALFMLAPIASHTWSLPTLHAHGKARESRMATLVGAVDREQPDAPLLVLGDWPQVYTETKHPCIHPRLFTALVMAQDVAMEGDRAREQIRALFRKRPVILVTEQTGEIAFLDTTFPGWRDELIGWKMRRIDSSAVILTAR